MKTYIAELGDRLDQITFKEYGTLKVYDKLLEANKHLVTKIKLSDGDIVNLPVIEIPKETIKEVKSLW
jgi:phage tail protein X